MNRFREVREDCDYSQATIAKVIHTTQQHYSKIEAGKSDMPCEKLLLLAEFYNLSTDYLLGVSEEKRPLVGQQEHYRNGRKAPSDEGAGTRKL